MAGASPPGTGYVFDYLVIVDLETTCDDMNDPNRQEIVDWPWVVYDIAHGVAVDHKQIFVAPAWNTNDNPPPHAVRELGVDVAFAASLREAVAQFDAYLYHSFVAHGKSFCLLTDGPWDVQHLLLLEAARKAVPLAPHFRAFFDLRAEFAACYPSAPRPRDRNTMVGALGIALAQPATGIDECVALAQIVSRMQYDGHVFDKPHVIPDYEWSAALSRVPAVASPVAAAVPVGGIVRLRGLPWSCTDIDIARFLHPIPIVPAGIHFVRNSHGKATGEAFVQLETEDAVKMALARHRQSMGRRYIEVFKSSPPDMSNHLGRADARRIMHQQHQAHAHVHKAAAAAAARAAAAAVAGQQGQMYPGASSMPHGVPSRNGIGVAHSVGARKSEKDDDSPRVHKSADGSSEKNAVPVPGSGTGLAYVVRVSGLPREYAPDDLLPLFSGLEMVGNGIHLVPLADADEGATGDTGGRDAFVQLTSETWAKKAIQRTGATLMGSAVSIHRSSASEMHSALGNGVEGTQKRIAGMPGNGRNRSRSSSASRTPGEGASLSPSSQRSSGGEKGGPNGAHVYALQARNVGSDATVESIAKLFSNLGVSAADVTFSRQATGSSSDKGGESVARVAFQSREARDLALADRNLAPSGLRWEESRNGNTDWKVRAGNGTGTVVRMRGLPYTSTEDDIRAFFDGFDIAAGGIARGKDRHGRASGEAWVTFADAADAQRAVATLDKAHMGTRYIELLMTR